KKHIDAGTSWVVYDVIRITENDKQGDQHRGAKQSECPTDLNPDRCSSDDFDLCSILLAGDGPIHDRLEPLSGSQPPEWPIAWRSPKNPESIGTNPSDKRPLPRVQCPILGIYLFLVHDLSQTSGNSSGFQRG